MANKRKDLRIEGPNLWYLVGLITSDGNLSKDGRHIDITSKDHKFLSQLKNSLKFDNKIGIKNKDKINECFHLQFSNRNIYEFLLSIGLTPNKSLIQNKVDVPEKFFCDFLRGLIDGDGSIRKWIHPTNKKEQWSLRLYSASLPFVEWLKEDIGRIFKVDGRVHRDKRKRPRVDLFVLKYGKVAARVILNKIYYQGALSLDRKRNLAKECSLSYIGWKNSKLVSLN